VAPRDPEGSAPATHDPQASGEPVGSGPGRTVVIALCAAALALAASFVAAVGPARGEHAEYSWPPPTLPAKTPREGWYAPLPLLNRVPASIDVHLPCTLSPPLRKGGPTTVLSTTRRSQNSGALEILLESHSLRYRVGASELARVPWPKSCPLQVALQQGELRLPGRAFPLHLGTPGEMPIVTGLFTRLDIRHGAPPQVLVQTRVYATSQTTRQVIAAVLAVLLACAALLLVAGVDPWRNPFPALRRALRGAWDARHPTDAVVVGVLLVWWIIAPTFTDDGWVWVENRTFSDLGQISLYYDDWALNSPIGYWLTWLGHWVVGSTNDLVFMRLLALATLLASWPLCRWCLHRVAPGSTHASAPWTLAAVFLLGATAWGMTLRPEPVVSLLALACLAGMLSFALRPAFVSLQIALLSAGLAIAVHPVGILGAAPVVAGGMHVIGWLRTGGRTLLMSFAALVLAGLALALVVLALGADLTTRLNDANLLGQADLYNEPWWREFVRYLRFDERGGGTAIRRLSLAAFLLSVLALLTRSRATRTGVMLLPARSVALGLLLLAFVPSKWPWHFGALATIGAVAVAAEAERIAREQLALGRSIRPIATLVLVATVTLWSWGATGDWSSLDLQEASWSWVFGFWGYPWWFVMLALASAITPITVLLRHRTSHSYLSKAGFGWSIAIVSLAAVGLTAAILLLDMAGSPWSPGRQNLDALATRSSCGLAHQLAGDTLLAERIGDDATRTLIAPSLTTYFPCATIPKIDGGLVELPELAIRDLTKGPLFWDRGPFSAAEDLYGSKSVGHGPVGDGVEVYSVDARITGFARVEATRLLGDSRQSGSLLTLAPSGTSPSVRPGVDSAATLRGPLGATASGFVSITSARR
jgi:arabinosyltransferase B